MAMTHDVNALLASLDNRMNRLTHHEPFPMETRRSLDETLRTQLTYASNAMEGNHLTLAETHIVLSGITVGGKPLRDHLEAIDHADAWDAVVQWAQSSEPLNASLLRSLHHRVLRRSQPTLAGQYRPVSVAIAGCSGASPNPFLMPYAVDTLLSSAVQTPMAAHPVVVGAILHAGLISLHPFVEGNHRTARLLLNLWLMRHRYVPTLLEPNDRVAYDTALAAADDGLCDPIVTVVAHGISRTLRVYEEVLGLEREPPTPPTPGQLG